MTKDNTLKIVALHRHWIVADAVKTVLKQQMAPEDEANSVTKFGLEYFAFGTNASMICRLQVWYALLFVVIEGYEDLKLQFEPLDKVLAQRDYVDSLRRFRNATFHYQADPLNDKLINFLDKADSESWIRELNKQMNSFFMQALPIKETLEKIAEFGLPKIPPGSKMDTLFRGPKA